jgi:hypothetical protein
LSEQLFLGAQVFWDGNMQSITAEKGDMSVKLIIDSDKALINNKEVILDVAPRLLNGTSLVPVRFVSEALGAEVSWDAGEAGEQHF